MIIERKYCTKCKTEENIAVYSRQPKPSGDTYVYYMCRTCNAERKRGWYNNGNQRKAAIYNRRYKIRKEMNPE